VQWIPLSRVRQVECQTAIVRIAVGHVLKKLRERPDRKRALPRVSLMAGDLRRRVPPRQVAADGGYASQDNLTAAKARGVNDVAFHKKRGLTVEDMVKSRWVYRKLRNFRAGMRPGSPASSEPTVWRAVPGAGSIISRPTSGPQWWRTT
jgi:hypothetical protein